MDIDEHSDFIDGFLITDCIVREKNIIYFMGEEDLESKGIDTYEQLPDTRVITHYPDEPKGESWGTSTFNHSIKMKAGVCYTPEERFIGVDARGLVYVIGGGSSGFEKSIDIHENAYITKVKCISNGKAYAVGTLRAIYRRDDVDTWAQITQADNPKIPEYKSNKMVGFNDIDGYSDNDLYVCGYNGEIDHFDGKQWSTLKTPTDYTLNQICCAEDGYIYVAGNHGILLKGRGEQWELIEQGMTEASLDNIAWFNDRLFFSSWDGLYELVDNEVKQVNPGPGIPPFYYGKGLSARDGIMVTAGHSSALQFDGLNWTVLVGLENDSKLMDNIINMEAAKASLEETNNKLNELQEAIDKAQQ